MGSRKDRSLFFIRAWCSGVPMDTFFIRAWCSGVPPSPNTILVPSFEHRVVVLSRIGQIVRPAHIRASSWGYEERSWFGFLKRNFVKSNSYRACRTGNLVRTMRFVPGWLQMWPNPKLALQLAGFSVGFSWFFFCSSVRTDQTSQIWNFLSVPRRSKNAHSRRRSILEKWKDTWLNMAPEDFGKNTQAQLWTYFLYWRHLWEIVPHICIWEWPSSTIVFLCEMGTYDAPLSRL